MVNHHRENQQPPHGRGSQIPIRATALRRPGLHSGGPPPEPATENPTPRITIQIPARTGNGETGPTAPNMTPRGIPEIAPPQYTEWVGPESVAIPRSDGIEPSNTKPDRDDGETIRVSQTELTTGDEQNEGLSGLNAMWGSAIMAPSVSQQIAGE